MKVLNVSNKLKKIITVMAMTVFIIGSIQPMQAKGATSNSNTTYQTDTVYQPKATTILGIAADFGIFAKESFTTHAHSDSNFACGKLVLDRNITARTKDAVNYAGQVQTSDSSRIDYGYLYVGTGKVTKDSGYWLVDKNNNVATTEYENGELKFKGAYTAPKFINLDEEFTRLTALAYTMSKYEETLSAADYKLDDQNSMEINCKSNYNVLNIAGKNSSGKNGFLNIKNLRGDKLLIINVNMDGFTGTYDFSQKVQFDKVLDGFDKDASNVIWNFNNFSGTIRTSGLTAGVILAPQADVILGDANHIGIVIAKSLVTNHEVHYVPYQYRSSIAIQSVDGNCCPSKPLSGVKFAIYTTDGKLVEGTEKEVASDYFGNFSARWEINKPGRYYIQETQVPAGYVKDPIKSRFDITEVDGRLKLTMIKGKEANGYTSTIKNLGGEDRFFIRHYSNEVFAVALDAKTLELLPNTSFEVYQGTPSNTIKQITEVSVDEKGFFSVNIPEAGYYYIKQTVTQAGYKVSSEIKEFAVYRTPIGHHLVVELDDAVGKKVLSILQSHLGTTMDIKKFTAAMNKELIAYGYKNGVMTNDYDAITDACIIYMN